MKVILEATSGPATGRKIVLRPQQSVRIGRTQLADYTVSDDCLSSVHFAVSYDGKECRLEDLGSSNGSFVNGKQVMEAMLQTGDEITAGRSRFSVQIDSRATFLPGADLSTRAYHSLQKVAPHPQGRDRSRADFAPEQESQRSPDRPLPRVGSRRFTALIEMPAGYERGLSDEDPDVFHAALFAAVYTRQPWLLRHFDRRAEQPAPDDLHALRMFAILAEPRSLPTILSIIRNSELPPERFEVAGAFGHPGTVKDLLVAMSWKDMPAASQAAQAFEKITGAEVALTEGDEAAVDESQPAADSADAAENPPPADPGVEVEQARAFWRSQESRFVSSPRWSRGRDVSKPFNDQSLRELDLQSRWEVLLREHFYRRREVPQVELELVQSFAGCCKLASAKHDPPTPPQ